MSPIFAADPIVTHRIDQVVELADPDLSNGLSLEYAIKLALSRNPELRALRAGRQVAQQRLAGVQVLPSPELRIGYPEVVGDPVNRFQNNVGLRWAVPRPTELKLKAAFATGRIQEANATIAVAEQRVAAEVRMLYQTVQLCDEQIRVAEALVAVRQQFLDAVQAQVAAGVKGQLERTAAELSLAETRTAPERYRTERRVQMTRLLNRMAVDSTLNPRLSNDPGVLRFEQPILHRDELLSTALQNRAEIDRANAQCTESDTALKVARSELYPWLSSVQVIRRFRNDDPSRWGFQVGVDLPVFRWGGAFVHTALAQVNQCKLQERAVKASVAAEIDELFVRLNALSRELSESHNALATLSQSRLEVARLELAVGQADLLEPLLARAQQLNLQQLFIARLIEFRALEAGLKQATGDAAIR